MAFPALRHVLAAALALVAMPAAAQDSDWEHHTHRSGGAHVRIGSSYHLLNGAVAAGPVVVIGGSANIDGEAREGVVVVGGGELRIGPNARISGDVVAVAAGLSIDPAAEVHGEVSHVTVRWPGVTFGWAPLGWWAAALLGLTLFRLALVFVGGGFLSVVAPNWIERVSSQTAAAPVLSLAIGLTAQILFVPALVMLVVALSISIIGIPLLAAVPLLIAAFVVIWLGGFTGTTIQIGARLRGTVPHTGGLGRDMVAGLAVLTALIVAGLLGAFGPVWLRPAAMALGITGVALEYVAWTIGLGAALTSLSSRPPRTFASPPPLPVHPAAQHAQ